MRLADSSGQVVELDETYRNRIKSQQTKTYFYGEPPLPPSLAELPGRMVAMEANLHPHSFTVSWDDLEIYRIGEGALFISPLWEPFFRLLRAQKRPRRVPHYPWALHASYPLRD